MNAVLLFFKAWLLVCFALTFFVVPLYLVAIYPEVPEPYYRFVRSLGYGVVHGPPSTIDFWYRILGCGTVIILGLLIVTREIRDIRRSKQSKGNSLRSMRSRRVKGDLK